MSGNVEVATLAGGCFWCIEGDFIKVDGVIKVISGYTGGESPNPSYEDVCRGDSGHIEAVEVHFDPLLVGYEKILQHFWQMIDPTDAGGQFADRGPQYRPVIFFHSSEQQRIAESSKAELERSGKFPDRIAVDIIPAVTFYPAEDYHQGYSCKSPQRYQQYRKYSGRESFISRFWSSD